MSFSETLAAAQGALVRALDGELAPPPGFDRGRLDAMARILAGKRSRAVAAACPTLRRGLGARFDSLFREYARGAPLLSTVCATGDACRFLAWLRDRRALPAGIRLGTFRLGFKGRIIIAWLGPERRLLIG